jgi:hypothetical protein
MDVRKIILRKRARRYSDGSDERTRFVRIQPPRSDDAADKLVIVDFPENGGVVLRRRSEVMTLLARYRTARRIGFAPLRIAARSPRRGRRVRRRTRIVRAGPSDDGPPEPVPPPGGPKPRGAS